jgi:hypothetical protein
MVWKVAGELVIPKNITCGSKRPWLVMNAAFHWSPLHIRMLLYPQQMLNLVNKLAPQTLAMSSGMSGSGVAFRRVHSLSFR